jgi:hypothetical protein
MKMLSVDHEMELLFLLRGVTTHRYSPTLSLTLVMCAFRISSKIQEVEKLVNNLGGLRYSFNALSVDLSFDSALIVKEFSVPYT